MRSVWVAVSLSRDTFSAALVATPAYPQRAPLGVPGSANGVAQQARWAARFLRRMDPQARGPSGAASVATPA